MIEERIYKLIYGKNKKNFPIHHKTALMDWKGIFQSGRRHLQYSYL